MPTIATQTDPCVDVIDKLNQEFAEIQDELLNTQKQLKEQQSESVRDYHENIRHRHPGYMYDHKCLLENVLDEFQNKLATLRCNAEYDGSDGEAKRTAISYAFMSSSDIFCVP